MENYIIEIYDTKIRLKYNEYISIKDIGNENKEIKCYCFYKNKIHTEEQLKKNLKELNKSLVKLKTDITTYITENKKNDESRKKGIWDIISEHPKLTKTFIKKHKSDVNWRNISLFNKNLSYKFVSENISNGDANGNGRDKLAWVDLFRGNLNKKYCYSLVCWWNFKYNSFNIIRGLLAIGIYILVEWIVSLIT